MVTKAMAIDAGASWGQTTFYHISATNADGTACRCRTNGKCKTWKRQPERFQLPVKHGLKICFYITETNAHEWLTVDVAAVRRELKFDKKTPIGVIADKLTDLGREKEAQEILSA